MAEHCQYLWMPSIAQTQVLCCATCGAHCRRDVYRPGQEPPEEEDGDGDDSSSGSGGGGSSGGGSSGGVGGGSSIKIPGIDMSSLDDA
jgi:uncharacterized membrane protein YgcG